MCCYRSRLVFNCCFLRHLTFHKVVYRHAWSVVGSLVIVLLQVFYWFWQWNNFENHLIFDEVKAYKKLCHFWATYIATVAMNAANGKSFRKILIWWPNDWAVHGTAKLHVAPYYLHAYLCESDFLSETGKCEEKSSLFNIARILHENNQTKLLS